MEQPMTLIYGTKTYVLQQDPLSFDCKMCKHPEQSMVVIKSFFSLYYIPLIPLRKKMIIHCPKCSKEMSKRRFLQELSLLGKEWVNTREKMNQIVRSAKVPLKYYLPLLLTFFALCVFSGFIYQSAGKQRIIIKQFQEDPQKNALLAINLKSKSFPYTLIYISGIDNDNVIFYPFVYSFENTFSIDKHLANAEEQIRVGDMKEFGEELILTKEDFRELKIVRLRFCRE